MEIKKLKTFLTSLPIFEKVEEKAIDWLIEKGEVNQYLKGDLLFKPDDHVDNLLIFLEGSVDIYVDTPQGRQDLLLFEPGDISGHLPFSRSKGKVNAYGRVLEDLKLLELPKSFFIEMVNISYSLTQALVSVMSDRIRDTSENAFQDEKLKALGKISAGLAHELNNPISAIVRSSENLNLQLRYSSENFKAAMQIKFSPEEADGVNGLILKKIDAYKTNPKDFSLLERQDRMDDLLDWLDDHAINDSEQIAETFTEYNFTEEDLDKMSTHLVDELKFSSALKWMDHQLSVNLLVGEIKEASTRVATLVHSIKEYSHMDHGLGKEEIDLHDGLRTTLSILGHQFREKQINIDKQFEDNLPFIVANSGELNQVWTNLLANAIDVVEPNGKITISTFMDRDYICVCIEDNGAGIPQEILHQIWEPFFTTKKVGEGTGIGLDFVKKIIQRHKGSIRVESEPGKTRFIVKFSKK